MSEDQNNVIHVKFGASRPALRAGGARADGLGGDPLVDLYSRADVANLFGYHESRLRYWDRTGLVRPSGQVGARRYYTFQDLVSIRAAKGLLDQGVPLRRVRSSIEALRRALPSVPKPLLQLRVVAQGSAVVVKDEKGPFEAATGQGIFDFRVEDLHQDVVRSIKRTQKDPSSAAYACYLEGCRKDEHPATFEEAETAYTKALELNPSLSNAMTNLGNLRYRQGRTGEAERLYGEALAVDPNQPEALYNLGFLSYERGELAVAAEYFRRALKSDASFADAHFNLAMACEELGEFSQARPHWKRYLALDPSGPWADVARRHLRRDHPR